MKKITKYLICAAIVTLPAMAQEKPAEPGYHTHDGFYLNLMGGIGAAGFSETVGNASLTISGLAGHFGLKLGGAVADGVVLFGAVDGFSAIEPQAKVTVGSASGSGTLKDTTYNISTFGAGLGFYSSSNFFIIGSVGAARGTLNYTSGSTRNSVSTDTGFGANLNVGYEWWVSKDWGLGLAAVGHYSSVKDAGNTATQVYGGLSFTATYN